MRRSHFAVYGLAVSLLATELQAIGRPGTVPIWRPPVPLLPLPPDEQAGEPWSKYCGNLEMTGVAHDTRISPESVHRLRLLWTRALWDTVASQPSLSRGRVFIGDWSGTEYALNARNGDILAIARLGQTVAEQCNPPRLGITSAAAIVGDTVYLAGGDNGFYALDHDTLAVKWRTSLGDNSADGGYYGWCSPSVVEGRVLQGVSSNCDNPFVPGRLVALDSATGQFSDAIDMVPPDVVGGGIWTSPAVDLSHRKVFVTTASAENLDDGFSFCIVRLALDGLAIEDAWKVDPGNVPDADWGSSPTLFADGGSRQLVGAGQKDGFYYAFLRDNLRSGPVWKAPLARGGGCPQCCDGTLSTAAFDGQRLYVGAGAPPDIDAAEFVGTVSALEPATGAVLWRYEISGGPVIAPITVVNGVVFTAGANRIVALSAATGEELWSFVTPAWCYGGVAVANGRVFVGDTLGIFYAFGLPDDLSDRPAGGGIVERP